MSVQSFRLHFKCHSIASVRLINAHSSAFGESDFMSISKKKIVSTNNDHSGTQTGSNTWQIYRLEHGITSEGNRLTNYSLKSVFDKKSSSNFVPRPILINNEPTIIDSLINPENVISRNENAVDNSVNSYYSIGCEINNSLSESEQIFTKNG